MDYMKLVADLCQIIDRQNEITKAMAVQLGQRDALRRREDPRLPGRHEAGTAETAAFPGACGQR